MKYWLILTGFIFLAACSSEESEIDESNSAPDAEIAKGDLKTRAATHIKGQLKLTAIDKFDTTWYSKDITGDGLVDHIITVNLMDRAINEATAGGKLEKMQEMGFMGYYNHFFMVDGATEEISNSVVVASSPGFKLDVNFENILTSNRSDFYVDYRVRNMQRRKFFSIVDGKIKEVCQAIIFDGLGTSTTVAYDVRIEKGLINDFNDIVEYEAELEDIIIPNIDSTYAYRPEIKSTNQVIRRWHYSPNKGKYFMVQR